MYLIPLMILALIFLQFDDPLEPEVRALVEQTRTPKTSPAYLYLLGIDAPMGWSPTSLGEYLLDQSRLQDDLIEKDPSTTDEPELRDYQALSLPNGRLFCRWYELKCRMAVLSGSSEAPALSKTDQVVLDRYRAFMAMDGFTTLSKPSLHAPIPSYQHIIRGHRLAMLQLLGNADQDDAKKAIRHLSENLNRVRAHLANADTVIGKLVLLAVMSENLDVLSAALAESGYHLAPDLPPMSMEERDFTPAIAREFAMIYHLYQSMDRNSRFLETTSLTSPDSSEDADYVPGWWVRAIFKPNITSNASLPVYLQPIKLSKVEPADFQQTFANTENISVQTNWLRNPAGTILAGVGGPDFNDYVAESFNIDAKLDLLRQLIDLQGVPDNIQTLNNPIATGYDAVYWGPERHHLCLEGPDVSDRNFRCLVVRPEK